MIIFIINFGCKKVVHYPLSYNQLGIWLACIAEPESPAYNIVYAWDVRGDLDYQIIKECFQILHQRHEILRTSYVLEQNQPYQVIHDCVLLDIKNVDVYGQSEVAVSQLIKTESIKPFDLEYGPISRIRLYRTNHLEYTLLLVLHHIAVDLWSIKIIQDEFWTLYFRKKAGISLELPAPAIRYIDYIKLHEEMLLSAEGKKLFYYWRKQLAGRLPILNMPGEKWKNNDRSFCGETHRIIINTHVVTHLKRFCQQNKLTLFTVLFAVYQSMLSQYSGQSEIIIGTPMMGWRRSTFKTLVGNLVNIVPIRTRFAEGTKFTIIANQIAKITHEAMRHQGFAFGRMVTECVTNKKSQRSPIVQSLFLFQSQSLLSTHNSSMPEDRLRLQDAKMEVKLKCVTQQEGQFELALQICELKECLLLDFRYDTLCLNSDTASEFARNYVNHLESCITNSL